MWDILLDYQTMYKLNLKTYWLDFCVSTLIFILCLFNLNIFTFIVGAIFLYRAGAFTHEIAHQSKNPEITLFKTVWDYTLGFLILQPSLRFTKPHLAHHTTGIFGTVNDPQYPLIRSNTKLAFIIFCILPFALPIYNLLICSSTHWKNNPLEQILYKNINFTKKEYEEINKLESAYLVLFFLLCVGAPSIVIPLYFIEVAAWFLSVLRIPLEHDLKSYKETSVYDDQRLDSKTHESPIYIPIQPLALRFHTVHHMYPKVPYHNLQKLNHRIVYPHKQEDYKAQ